MNKNEVFLGLSKDLNSDKMKTLVLLALQTSIVILMTRYSRQTTSVLYLPTSAALMIELVNLLVFTVAYYLGTNDNKKPPVKFNSRQDLVKFCIVSLVNFSQTSLWIYALTFVESQEFQVAFQFKALLQLALGLVMLKTTTSVKSVLSVVLIFVGIATVVFCRLSAAGDDYRKISFGFLSIFAIAGLSLVENTMIEGDTPTERFRFRIKSSLVTIVLGFFFITVFENSFSIPKDMFLGFNSVFWLTVFLHVSLAFSKTAIQSNFGTFENIFGIISILLTTVGSTIIFGDKITIPFVLGTLLVIFGLYVPTTLEQSSCNFKRYNIRKLIIILTLSSIFFITFINLNYSSEMDFSKSLNFIKSEPQSTKTLVIYAYTEDDMLSKPNLEFFKQVGVYENEDLHYLFIVNGENCVPCDDISHKSRNVQVFYLKETSSELSLFNYGINSVDLNNYKYYIFLNQNVRGPLVPTYYDIKEWHKIFTRTLVGDIKLVGPTINCETQIHLQTHMFAMERELVKSLISDKFMSLIFSKLENEKAFSVELTELAFSRGFNIKSLQLEYAKTNWLKLYHELPNHGQNYCNDGRNVLSENYYGSEPPGYNISPFETIFHLNSGPIRKNCLKKERGQHNTPETCAFDYKVNDMTEWTLEYTKRIAELPKKVPVVKDKTDKTLVLIAYQEASPLYIYNVEYFIDVAVFDTPEIDYILIVNGDKCTPCQKLKEKNLENTLIVYRANQGFDFGAYYHVLKNTNIEAYKYYIFFNGGVRGPIVPFHYDLKKWYKIFTDRLVGDVKLVGPTVSCSIQIHIQSHMFALERDGVRVTMKDGIYVSNAKTITEVTLHSEFGLTNAILKAGYNIQSLQLEHYGKDWASLIYGTKDQGKSECGMKHNFLIEKGYGKYGALYSIDPLEVVFYKRGGSIRGYCARKGPGRFKEPAVCEFDMMVDDLSFWTQNAIH